MNDLQVHLLVTLFNLIILNVILDQPFKFMCILWHKLSVLDFTAVFSSYICFALEIKEWALFGPLTVQWSKAEHWMWSIRKKQVNINFLFLFTFLIICWHTSLTVLISSIVKLLLLLLCFLQKWSHLLKNNKASKIKSCDSVTGFLTSHVSWQDSFSCITVTIANSTYACTLK
jgi:hypothetical protein